MLSDLVLESYKDDETINQMLSREVPKQLSSLKIDLESYEEDAPPPLPPSPTENSPSESPLTSPLPTPPESPRGEAEADQSEVIYVEIY